MNLKNWFCVALAWIIALSMAACNQAPDNGETSVPANPSTPSQPEATVTICIPDTITFTDASGNPVQSVQCQLEDGWSTKESFTLTYMLTGEDGESLILSTLTYSENSVIVETPGSNRTETLYDAQGRTVSQTVTMLLETAPAVKTENTYTYDDFGRLLTQTTTTHYRDESLSPTTVTYTYTFNGNEGRAVDGVVEYVRIYDEEGRCTSYSNFMSGDEISRTENIYDASGNLIKAISYSSGVKITEIIYTWKTVLVSETWAQHMPQFNKAA